MSSKKETFNELLATIEHKERVQKQGGIKFSSLSEEVQEEQYQIAYLAELIVEIFLDKKCREGGHRIKKCEECQKNYPSRFL